MISALKIVDKVITYQSVNTDFLEEVDFDILALGQDHVAERWQKAEEWCNEHGKKVVRLKRTHGICSSGIKRNIAR